MTTEEIIEAMTKPEITKKPIYLPTGSTLLNLACSDSAFGGFRCGTFVSLVGDSSSGKTFLSLTCFAEACRLKRFDDYRLIFDNAENGAQMDFERFFGEKAARRIEPPAVGKDESPIHSAHVEDFYYHVDDAIKAGKPFIYVIDSLDALSSDDEDAKFEEKKKAARKGTQTTGSYGDGKAKIHSSNIRRIISKLEETNSILIGLSQTRDNIGFDAMFNPKSRSGGRAIKFYASTEMWTSIKKTLKKTVAGKDRQIGTLSQVHVKKNRGNGHQTAVTIPIYRSYGIDDVGSMVDWLVEEGAWDATGKKITATGMEEIFPEPTAREKIITTIEEIPAVKQLQMIVQEHWELIEEKTALKRKRRYE